MSEEVKEPTKGQPSGDVAEKAELPDKKGTESGAKEPSKAADQNSDKGKPDYVSRDEYVNIQRLASKKDQEIAELRKELEGVKGFQKKLEGAFGNASDINSTQKSKKVFTPQELRVTADRWRQEGNIDEASCLSLETQADMLETINQFKAESQRNAQLNQAIMELSKPDSLIKPESIDWVAVGKISAEENKDSISALDSWIKRNLSKVLEPIIAEKTKTLKEQLAARSLDGDDVDNLTEEQKKVAYEEHARIGDPRQWKKK